MTLLLCGASTDFYSFFVDSTNSLEMFTVSSHGGISPPISNAVLISVEVIPLLVVLGMILWSIFLPFIPLRTVPAASKGRLVGHETHAKFPFSTVFILTIHTSVIITDLT